MAKTNSDQLHGTLDMLVLKTLQNGRLHGYAVATRLEQLSNEVLKVEEGSLYPSLYRMEARGWLSSEWGLTETARRASTASPDRAARNRFRSSSGRVRLPCCPPIGCDRSRKQSDPGCSSDASARARTI
jgi:hypothetical protein